MSHTFLYRVFGLHFVVFFVAFFFVSCAATEAASLYVSPEATIRNVGRNFTIAIYVSSPDQAMNAASGILNFPVDKMEVLSLSKEGSIINLWVQEPSYSNREGRIQFEGVVLNPGFTGNGGRVISAVVRVKATGQVNLSFSAASVLANDGQGTNILGSMGTANYTFEAATEEPPPVQAPAASETLPALEIQSGPVPTPIIRDYTKRIRSFEEILAVHGTAAPNVKVVLYLRKGSDVIQFETRSNVGGEWRAEYIARIPGGTWELSAKAIDNHGVESYETAKVQVRVSSWTNSFLEFFGNYGLTFLLILILLLAILLLGYRLTHRFWMRRLRLRNELTRFREELRRDLKSMEHDLDAYTVNLDPASIRKTKELLKRKIEQLERDVADEIRRLDKF